jgi:non-specific serine/threonine protein kinase
VFSEAVRLFVERARAVREDAVVMPEDAATVEAICQRLDGLPLAIELAAARMNALSPSDLLTRLERRLPLLTGGPRDAPARLRTMRDAIAWSYDLLQADEQALFCRLAVFVGGFTLEAAEEVGGRFAEGGVPPPIILDLVSSLVDKNLLRAEIVAGGTTRYGMLETIREFGLDQLAASGEAEAVRQRHAAWCVRVAEEAGPQVMGANQAHWLDLLEREHDNLRAAMSWAHQQRDESTSLVLVEALGLFWYIRGHVAEGLRWLDQALALGPDIPSATRTWALIGAGHLAHYQGQTARAAGYINRALALSRERNDQAGTSQALLELGIMAEDQADYDAAVPMLEESLRLSLQLADLPRVARATYHLSVVAYGQGILARADALCAEALHPAREARDPYSIAAVQAHHGLVACDRGESARAAAALMEATSLYATSKDLEGIARCLANFAVLATTLRQWPVAAGLIGAVESLKQTLGYGFHPPEAPRYALAEVETRRALGEAFAAQFAAGQAWAIEEALAVATEIASGVAPEAMSKDSDQTATHGLTPREREILRLLASGHSNRAIAERLFISPTTVATHLANLYGKLGVDSRAQAIAYAHRHDLD